MEFDATLSEFEKNQTGNKSKSRRSLFLPPEVTISEPTKIEVSDEEYIKKLQFEKTTWKQLYNEQKEKKQKLLKKLDSIQNIDYGLFTPEELKYINAGPDVAAFVREAEDFQNLIKSVRLQSDTQRQRYNSILKNIENACQNMESTINS